MGNSPTLYTDPTGKFANFIIGAGFGLVTDLTFQLLKHKGDWTKLDPMQLAMSTLSGAIGGAVSARIASLGAKFLQRLLMNAITSGAVDGGLQVGRNLIEGKDLSTNVAQQSLTGFAGGALGEVGELGVKQLGKIAKNVAGQFMDFVRKASRGGFDDVVEQGAKQVDDVVKQSAKQADEVGDANGIFKSGADPLEKKYGAAIDNYPEEFESAYQELENAGVKFINRPNNFAYGPASTPGKPGRFIFDINGSIGALRHEMRHFRDDLDAGYPGLATYLKDPNLFWKFEFRGYMEEVNFAREQRDFESAREIVKLMRNRRKEILGK